MAESSEIDQTTPAQEDTKEETEKSADSKQEEESYLSDPPVNRIIVSRARPLSFYVDRSRRILRNKDEHDNPMTMTVTGFGDAIAMACTLVEVLKRQKIAEVVKIQTLMDTNPSFRGGGKLHWDEPTPRIIFDLKAGELAPYIADYHQRKVIEIFESNDSEHTGKVSVDEVKKLPLAEAFRANEEQVTKANEFLGKQGSELDLPAFIKYTSELIHPLLRDKAFKEGLANHFPQMGEDNNKQNSKEDSTHE